MEHGDLADVAGGDELHVRERAVGLARPHGAHDLDARIRAGFERQLQADRADVAVGQARDPLRAQTKRPAVGVDAPDRALEP